MDRITVHFYNKIWGLDLNFQKVNFPIGFKFTKDLILINDADAVVFHIPSLQIEQDLIKGEKKVWIYWSMVCEKQFIHH